MLPINQIVKNMKRLIIVAVLCVGYINSAAVHNGFGYYRVPSFSGYYRPYPMHQAMFLHYNNPYSARTSHASEITAFASGDRIGTGTYYENGREPAQEFQPPPLPISPSKPEIDLNEQSSDESSGNAVSIAEAFPEEEESHGQDSELQQENEVLFETGPTISYEPLPQKESAPTAKPAKPIVAQPPKINVEIESNEGEDDIVPLNTKTQQGSWPLNNFFPISFGSTSGGAIAIANSFSTGKGGTAVSRATAYGSPSKQKLKKQLRQ